MQDPDTVTLDRGKLRLGKYTRGYADWTADQIEALLWLLGEWTVRGDSDHRRAVAAREALLDRTPLTLEEVQALMRGDDDRGVG